MKHFKTQRYVPRRAPASVLIVSPPPLPFGSIDTPGVIDRVVVLFRNHPLLIQNFNTFLPVGFRLECSSLDGSAENIITIHTPMGVTRRTESGIKIDDSVAKTPAVTAPAPASYSRQAPMSSTAPSGSAHQPRPPAHDAAKPTQAPRTQPDTAAQASASPASQAGRLPASAQGRQPPTSGAASLHMPSLPPPPSAPSAPKGGIATPGAASLLSSHLSHSATSPADHARPQSQQTPSQQQAASHQGQQQSAQPQQANASTAAPEQGAAGGQRPLMEFNHAINYVNKIKNRFVRDPDTYKSFLEILQTYQREGKAIQDVRHSGSIWARATDAALLYQVYAQVTILFQSAPDLLEEFKQFLPEANEVANAQAAQAAAAQPARGGQGAAKRAFSGAGGRDDAVPTVKRPKTTKAKVDDKGKGKRIARDDAGAARPFEPAGDKADPAMYQQPAPPQHLQPHQAGYPSYPAGPGYGPPRPPPPPPGMYAYDTPTVPPPPQPLLPSRPQAKPTDLALFQRIKHYINDPPTYHEFLRLLNLFTQDIIDLPTLASHANLFLGKDTSLWRDFRDMVGWTDGQAVGASGATIEIVDGVQVIDNVPRVDSGAVLRGEKAKGWESCGPSYRKLPSSVRLCARLALPPKADALSSQDISRNCSGRDSLCWEVLNDAWVCQPSATSDEGFIFQQKNSFQEALQRSEEERHEYDYHIEANIRSISALEPIATRIAIMDPEERSSFKLKGALGGQSKSVFQRIIKKVYGREHGAEVMKALYENPCVAVPIVLARLKQKDDEWKRALREWNRVWRDVDARNYWKALDYQSLQLKANDKRTLTNKHFITEIEMTKREQIIRAAAVTEATGLPRFQLKFAVPDRRAVFDTLKMCLSYVERTNTLALTEKDKVDALLRTVFAAVFVLSPAESAVATFSGDDGADFDDDSVDGFSEAGTSALGDTSEIMPLVSKGKKSAADLRRRALRNIVAPSERATRKGGKGKNSAASGASSRAVSPSAAPSLDVTMSEGGAPFTTDDVSMPLSRASSPASTADNTTNIEDPSAPTSPRLDAVVPLVDVDSRRDIRRRWHFFTNTSFYCLIRLVQVLYSRLEAVRKESAALAPIVSRGAASKDGQGKGLSADALYESALALCERLFEDEIEQSVFEDTLRQAFGLKSYIIFTVERLVSAIIKQAQAAIADPRSQELLDLVQQDRSHPDRNTAQQQTAYRQQAEKTLGMDENMYRIEWAPATSTMFIQLLGKDSITSEDSDMFEREWGRYLDDYALAGPTPGVAPVIDPFLKR